MTRQQLEKVISDLEDATRQIYYAKACLQTRDWIGAEACLDVALKTIGVNRPEDVGLSSKSLFKAREKNIIT